MADSNAPPAPRDPEIKEEELDASIEDTINPNPLPETTDAMNLDGANDDGPVAPALEPKIPVKKDASLREFLSKMDDYAPIVSLIREPKDTPFDALSSSIVDPLLPIP